VEKRWATISKTMGIDFQNDGHRFLKRWATIFKTMGIDFRLSHVAWIATALRASQ
jgi:hypothetical protein